MRKIILTLGILLSIGGMASAQKAELSERDEFIRYESSLLGMDENNYYVLVGYSYDKKDNYKGTILYTYDKNLKIVDKTNIDEKTREVATDAFVTDNKISMIRADYNGGKIHCHVIDKATKKCDTKTYFDDNLDRRDRLLLSTAKSADDSLFFAMKTVYNAKDESIKSSKMILFDNELNELWQKEYFAPASSLFLTNDGEVIAVGHYITDDNNSVVRFTTINGDDEVYVDEEFQNFRIGDINVAACNNDELIMYGLIKSDDKRLDKIGRTYYKGFFSFTYNLKTRAIGTINKYDFTADDYKIIMNQKAGKKLKVADVAFLQPLEVLPTSDGGVVVAYNPDYETVIKSQYGVSRYKSKESVLIWRLRPDGTIAWHNGFRRIMNTGMFENSWYTPHYITETDEVVFIVEDDIKDKLDNESPVKIVSKSYAYEASKPAGKLPTRISMIRFDKDGNVTKEALHSEKKMLLVGKHYVLDNGKAVLLYVSNKKEPGGLIRIDIK